MALRFRFTAEQDIAQYGDGWWVWDEAELTRLPGRDLAALEEAVDMPLWRLRNELHKGATMATMAAMWIAMHRAGHPVGWEQFNPAVLLATWEVVPAAPLESGEDPAPAADSSTTPPPSPESATS